MLINFWWSTLCEDEDCWSGHIPVRVYLMLDSQQVGTFLGDFNVLGPLFLYFRQRTQKNSCWYHL